MCVCVCVRGGGGGGGVVRRGHYSLKINDRDIS